jgi:hypothetical protein
LRLDLLAGQTVAGPIHPAPRLVDKVGDDHVARLERRFGVRENPVSV